jgi:hypothetical protein
MRELQRTETAIIKRAIENWTSDDDWQLIDGHSINLTKEEFGYQVAVYLPGPTTYGECDIYATVDSEGEQVTA